MPLPVALARAASDSSVMLIFSPNHSAALARAIAAAIGTSLSASEEREFDGGEHKMRPLVDVAGRDVCVVQGLCGDALYFSRCPIPYKKRVEDGVPTLRHIGVYAFARATLLEIPALPSSGLDETEGLEQLRFLENGIAMRIVIAEGDPWGIETRADYDAFLVREAQRRIKGGKA